MNGNWLGIISTMNVRESYIAINLFAFGLGYIDCQVDVIKGGNTLYLTDLFNTFEATNINDISGSIINISIDHDILTLANKSRENTFNIVKNFSLYQDD